jgi:hypothetical protein
MFITRQGNIFKSFTAALPLCSVLFLAEAQSADGGRSGSMRIETHDYASLSGTAFFNKRS